MELIAASRINRARRAVEAARPYAEGISGVIRDLLVSGEVADHPLLAPHAEIKRAAILVVTSDRGLAGAYNTNILRRAERIAVQEREAGRDVVLYTLGRKAEGYFTYRGLRPEQSWVGITDRPQLSSAQEVGRVVSEAYVEGRLDRIWLAYTEFRSALSQVPTVHQVLPIVREEMHTEREGISPQFIFEPDPGAILTALIPRYVEQQIFAALLEGAASEHASRQRAMKAATDNAGDIIDDLTRNANAARQAAITTEISEIVGGSEALSS